MPESIICAHLLKPRLILLQTDSLTRLSLFRLITKDNYEQYKADYAANIPGYFDGTFNQFDEKRRKDYEEHHFDLTVQQSMSYLSIDLSDDQIAGFVTCVRNTYPGLFCYVEHESKDVFSIKIQWVPLGGVGFVKDTYITTNGTVDGENNFHERDQFAGEDSVTIIRAGPDSVTHGSIHGTTVEGGSVSDDFWVPPHKDIVIPPPIPYGGSFGKSTNVEIEILERPYAQEVNVLCTAKHGHYRPGDPWSRLVYYRDGAPKSDSGQVGYIGGPKPEDYIILTAITNPIYLQAGQSTTLRAWTDNNNLDSMDLVLRAVASPAIALE